MDRPCAYVPEFCPSIMSPSCSTKATPVRKGGGGGRSIGLAPAESAIGNFSATVLAVLVLLPTA